jgi:hypothetical protein
LLTHGEILPESVVLDHLCGERACVRPSHLQPVTQVENIRRGRGKVGEAMRAREVGECRNGHDLAEVGTYANGTSTPKCRACVQELRRVRWAANRDAMNEKQRARRNANIDAVRERERAYVAANREKINARKLDAYYANREEHNAARRAKYSARTAKPGDGSA